MKNIVDFENVLKVFLGQGSKITSRLKDALEKNGPARLDETTREIFLEFGDFILQEVIGQIGESIRFSNETRPVCECCGQPLEFKQMRKMPFRSALTGKSREIKSPMAECCISTGIGMKPSWQWSFHKTASGKFQKTEG